MGCRCGADYAPPFERVVDSHGCDALESRNSCLTRRDAGVDAATDAAHDGESDARIDGGHDAGE